MAPAAASGAGPDLLRASRGYGRGASITRVEGVHIRYGIAGLICGLSEFTGLT